MSHSAELKGKQVVKVTINVFLLFPSEVGALQLLPDAPCVEVDGDFCKYKIIINPGWGFFYLYLPPILTHSICKRKWV